MLEAGSRLLARGDSDFGYLFVVGEEVDNAGARAANRISRGRYLIVGEPTENKIAVGHKGVLGVRIKVKGVPCHSAYPDQGDSAVHRLLSCLLKVLAADFGTSELLGPATVNIGEVHGGVAPNVLAPSAEATVVVRVVGEMSQVERTLERCFWEPGGSAIDPKVELVTYTRMIPPRLERVVGYPQTIVSYGTDIPFLAEVGKPVLFGPGSILDAHTDHERIEKRALLEAVEAYVDIAKQLMNRH
jgi:acetylornithine deacetylase